MNEDGGSNGKSKTTAGFWTGSHAASTEDPMLIIGAISVEVYFTKGTDINVLYCSIQTM